MSGKKLLLAAILGAVIAAYFALDLGQYSSLEYVKSQQQALEAYSQAHPGRVALIYGAFYVIYTGLSLPGALVLTLLGGALFGIVWGTVIVSVGSTLGATLAFLVARWLLRDWVQERFGHHLQAVNDGVARDGAFYLFTLRLIPLFPFVVVNLVMALTPMRTLIFLVVSQIGMLPATVVFVNAGRQIAQLQSLGGILSPTLLASFTLLGLFPLLSKKLVEVVQARRVLRPYPRPPRFDRDLVVVGAGSAGLVSAYIAAAVRAKVSLVEKGRMGGDCLNTGCVPSKALIRSARFLAQVRRAREYGIRQATAEFDFAEVMERVRRVVEAIEPHDSVERYAGLGVECIHGAATITSPYSVAVDGHVLTTRAIVIAAGAHPFVPSIPGLSAVGYLTSDTIWDLRTLPRRLLVLGGGPIGCELAQCFARFGSRVTQVEMLSSLLSREDPEASDLVTARFRAEGIDVRLGHRAREFVRDGGHKALVCEHGGEEVRFEFDEVLIAVGRAANVEGYGLEALGILRSEGGAVETDDYLRTRYPNIYACGDVVGPFQYTHAAAHQAWYATINALFGGIKRFKADYSAMPHATFTEPEVARVGLTECEAQARGIAYEVTRYGIDDLDRAIADSAADGFVKLLTVPGKDRILGATIAGEHAAEMIGEYVSAMRNRLGLSRILGTIHVYPTFGEANKHAAGAWKRSHLPVRLLRWAERYHRWRRGG